MGISREVVDGVWKTTVATPSAPVITIDGDEAGYINGRLDELAAGLDALREIVAGAADERHGHTLADVDGAIELRDRVETLTSALGDLTSAVAALPTSEDLAAGLATKADATHTHDGFALLDDDGHVPRELLPAIAKEDLPAHTHQLDQINGIGAETLVPASALDDIRARLDALERRKK